jgi:energy-coupling factor transport system ATP-binding protein
MAEPAFRCEGFSYRYPGAAEPALRGLDLRVDRGELVVLCGLSGSGKTTLLRAASGLVPHFHGGEIEGALEVAGRDVAEHGPAELAAFVGLVAQEPESQVVSTNVRAEVELPLELRGVAPDQRARAVEEVALALAIPDLLERTTDTLSGGELQRVALAAALVTRPALVLLDEPTSQLDPVAGDELIGLLRRLNEEWGVTILLGEHRLERCLGAADRVIAMDAGTVAFDGAPEAFLEWALRAAPALATPAASLFAAAGLPAPASVRGARRALARRHVRLPEREPGPERPGVSAAEPALVAERLWVALGEREERIEALRGLDLTVACGERVALMGRNGAGKSTLLRAAAGLVEPGRGKVGAPGGVALLPQRPGDLIVRERVADELPGEAGAAALALMDLEGVAGADPRDLSGGERQRLALAIVAAGRGAGAGEPPGAVLLDEPTRGMDRARKAELAAFAGRLSDAGAAVVIATHDVEFAASFAERVVLMGRGEVVADGPAGELLAGGWYFSTEVARILDGAAIVPPRGARLLCEALARSGAARRGAVRGGTAG